jgi:hypothetical protein
MVSPLQRTRPAGHKEVGGNRLAYPPRPPEDEAYEHPR